MPTNLYGTGDNFHPEESHVLPALMRRIYEAKESGASCVTIWGTGSPMREFLHVDDLADACVHIMQLPKNQIDAVTEPMTSHINVGTGVDVTIKEVAELICKVVGYTGELSFDTSKPDGTPRKLLDASKINALGWQAKIELEAGLKDTYTWFFNNQATLRQYLVTAHTTRPVEFAATHLIKTVPGWVNQFQSFFFLAHDQFITRLDFKFYLRVKTDTGSHLVMRANHHLHYKVARNHQRPAR